MVKREKTIEPRWPALVALLAVGGLYLALPNYLNVGPRWFLLLLIILLTIPSIVFHRWGKPYLNQLLGYVVTVLVTGAMTWSLVLLVVALPTHKESPTALLFSAAALWLTNVLVFASWYWRLDGGGPNQRDRVVGHSKGAFLFPQMTMTESAKQASGQEDWSPRFVDYLFLAFNTSTAFSPTDSPVLSRWAKLLMMIQSIISLSVIALLAARAVNIL